MLHINTNLTPYILSLVDFIERSGIVETAVPNLVHNLIRMRRISTPWPRRHTQRGSPPHTLLHLLCDTPLASCEKLPAPTTLATERTCADLRASRMPQIMHRVHLKPQVIVSVHHLMRDRILGVSPVAHLVCADENAVLGIEAAGLLRVAFLAYHALGRYRGAAVAGPQQVDVVLHEADDGRVGEQPFRVADAALTVGLCVDGVFDAEVGFALAG